MITIELQGEPRGKGRPRSRVAWTKDQGSVPGKPFVALYTDAETRAYETALAWQARRAMRGRPPLEGPLTIAVEAHFSVPASWTRKKRDAALAAGVGGHTSKPDFDNLMKMVDALKGIVWRDDALVVEARFVKLYSERPMFRIDVEEIAVGLFRASEVSAERESAA